MQANCVLRNEIASLKTKYSEQEETIKKLDAQLKELIAAKSSHETELLGKFCVLLNEKKAKIRDQQRLLASAKIDPQKVAEIDKSRKGTKTKAAGSSRAGKRKAGEKIDPSNDEAEDNDGGDTDEGWEKMDVDVDQVPNDSDQEVVQTPEPDDEEETMDENEEPDDVPPIKLPTRRTRQATAGRGKTTAKDSKTSKSTNSKAAKKPKIEETSDKTPPRRELPFPKKKGPPAKPPIDAADDETASEDDEL